MLLPAGETSYQPRARIPPAHPQREGVDIGLLTTSYYDSTQVELFNSNWVPSIFIESPQSKLALKSKLAL